MIFYPTDDQYYTPTSLGIKHEEIFLKTRDGLRLHGWWLNSSQPKKANIVYVHGNAQNISAHIASVAWLTKKGFDVFLFDYRGYGISQGETEINGVISDALDAIEYGIKRSVKEKVPVFVLGQSLGASLSIYAVANSPVKNNIESLIAVSAFSDYHQITQEALSNWWLTWILQWPLSLTINNDYRPLDHIADISPTPLVIMHSKQDEVIPYHHAIDLFAAAKTPKQLIELNDKHNNVLLMKSNRKFLLEYLEAKLKNKKNKP